MKPQKQKLIELGILPDVEESGVNAIALVEEPAIQQDFLYFKKEKFVEPEKGEHESDFISRCIAYNINEGKDPSQAAAICYSVWDQKHSKFDAVYPQPQEHKDDYLKRCITTYVIDKHEHPDEASQICHYLWNQSYDQAKISYDYDDTLTTPTGQASAIASRHAGYNVYVISARNNKDSMLDLTKSLGIPDDHVFATGSNEAKIAKVIELGINTHIDNNQEVVDALGEVGQKFAIDTSSLPQYVDEIPKNNQKDLVETPQPTWSWNWKFSDEFLVALETLGAELGFSADQVDVIDSNFFADVQAIRSSDYTPARTHKGEHGTEYLWKFKSSRVSNSGSRDFCRTMMSLNRYYSREEITLLDNLNQEFGPGGDSSYSIFKFKGGANCQHYWQKYSVVRDGSRLKLFPIDIDGSFEERMAATALRTQTGRGYLKSPQNALPGLSGHSEFSSVFQFADEEKRILVGPAMIPDMEIPRLDDNGQPYNVVFSADTIAEIAQKFLKEARTNDTNQDHIDNKPAGTYVYESWIVEDPKTDKANTVYGFSVPKGTWMVKMKVDDPQVWKRVKAGELKGFSVEGLFSDMAEIEDMRRYMKIRNILNN